jgi:hypothetical protein
MFFIKMATPLLCSPAGLNRRLTRNFRSCNGFIRPAGAGLMNGYTYDYFPCQLKMSLLFAAFNRIHPILKPLPDLCEHAFELALTYQHSVGQIFSSWFSTHPPIRKRIERLIGRDFI